MAEEDNSLKALQYSTESPSILGLLREHLGYAGTQLELGIRRKISYFPDSKREGDCLARKVMGKTLNYTAVYEMP